MIKLFTDYTRFASNKTMVIVTDKKLLWQGKVLLQECQTYARYVLWTLVQNFVFFLSDDSYRQSYVISFTVLKE